MHSLAASSARESDDDTFDASTILARLDKLRRALIVSVLSLFVAFVACFAYSKNLYDLLIAPVRGALPPGAILVATRVPEVFLVHLQMAFFAAVFVTAPVWLYQVWRFARTIQPLRRSFLPVLFLGCVLFLLGAAFGHFVLFPFGVRFLTTIGSPSTRLMLSVASLFSFYAQFVIGLGLAFQIPTVVLILSSLRLVTPRFLVNQLRIVTLGVFTLAAVLTPTPDLVTQCLLALPMMALYVGSIGLCWLVTRSR